MPKTAASTPARMRPQTGLVLPLPSLSGLGSWFTITATVSALFLSFPFFLGPTTSTDKHVHHPTSCWLVNHRGSSRGTMSDELVHFGSFREKNRCKSPLKTSFSALLTLLKGVLSKAKTGPSELLTDFALRPKPRCWKGFILARLTALST